MRRGDFRLGMALWGFEGWVGEFYPPGASSEKFLELYVERMTAVEGNTFFYAIPSPERVDGWRETMPEGFRICPKLHRDISHAPPLCANKDLAAEYIQVLKRFGDHLGPFHLQLSPSFGPDRTEDLLRFLRAWPRHRGPIAVEVRHAGWFRRKPAAELSRALADLGVARVLLDTRPLHDAPDDPQIRSDRQKPELPLHPELTAPFAFVRFIAHPNVDRNRSYLESWADRLDTWLEHGVDTYFFVHCPYEVHSPRIARMFDEILDRRGVDVPELPWRRASDSPAQESLL